MSRNNGITAHATGVLLSPLAYLRRLFWLLFLARENPTPAGRNRFVKWRNACPYMLKLDYISARFCFCVFHKCLFPFPNHLFLSLFPHLLLGCSWFCYFPCGGRGRRIEQDVREESWAVSESQHLICEGGFSSLVVCGLIPWHDAIGNLSPDEVL